MCGTNFTQYKATILLNLAKNNQLCNTFNGATLCGFGWTTHVALKGFTCNSGLRVVLLMTDQQEVPQRR